MKTMIFDTFSLKILYCPMKAMNCKDFEAVRVASQAGQPSKPAKPAKPASQAIQAMPASQAIPASRASQLAKPASQGSQPSQLAKSQPEGMLWIKAGDLRSSLDVLSSEFY